MTTKERGINKLNELFEDFKEKEINKSKEEIYNDAYKIASIDEYITLLQNTSSKQVDYILEQYALNNINLEDFWNFYFHIENSIFESNEAIFVLEDFAKYISTK